MSAAEADLVMTLFPLKWWRLGARRGVARPVRAAAGELIGALLAIGADRLFQPTDVSKKDVMFCDTFVKVLRRRLAEVAEVRSWLSRVLP